MLDFSLFLRRNQFLNQSFSNVRDLRRENRIQQQRKLLELRQLQLNERPLYRKNNSATAASSVEERQPPPTASVRRREAFVGGSQKDLFLANKKK